MTLVRADTTLVLNDILSTLETQQRMLDLVGAWLRASQAQTQETLKSILKTLEEIEEHVAADRKHW